jgi:hypothetical protein
MFLKIGFRIVWPVLVILFFFYGISFAYTPWIEDMIKDNQGNVIVLSSIAGAPNFDVSIKKYRYDDAQLLSETIFNSASGLCDEFGIKLMYDSQAGDIYALIKVDEPSVSPGIMYTTNYVLSHYDADLKLLETKVIDPSYSKKVVKDFDGFWVRLFPKSGLLYKKFSFLKNDFTVTFSDRDIEYRGAFVVSPFKNYFAGGFSETGGGNPVGLQTKVFDHSFRLITSTFTFFYSLQNKTDEADGEADGYDIVVSSSGEVYSTMQLMSGMEYQRFIEKWDTRKGDKIVTKLPSDCSSELAFNMQIDRYGNLRVLLISRGPYDNIEDRTKSSFVFLSFDPTLNISKRRIFGWDQMSWDSEQTNMPFLLMPDKRILIPHQILDRSGSPRKPKDFRLQILRIDDQTSENQVWADLSVRS